MTIKLSMPKPEADLKPRITVVGVGGAGGNAVNNMIQANLEGVDFVVANTDAQALGQSQADRKLQLGGSITQGLGAGSRPEIGRAAAEETIDEILDHLEGSHMVFVTAGMGGGTGTGAAPVIARSVREHGILTVGVVTKPFFFEGNRRRRHAEGGIIELRDSVDTLITIPNQRLLSITDQSTPMMDAFKSVDMVLLNAVQGISDLIRSLSHNSDLLKEKSLQPIYFPSINKENYDIFYKLFFKKFNSYPNQISFLSYDLVGLVYYLTKKNNLENINKIFDQKNIFKGKTGVFEIKDKKISHKLNFYKVENGKFIKIF